MCFFNNLYIIIICFYCIVLYCCTFYSILYFQSLVTCATICFFNVREILFWYRPSPSFVSVEKSLAPLILLVVVSLKLFKYGWQVRYAAMM